MDIGGRMLSEAQDRYSVSAGAISIHIKKDVKHQ